MTSLSYEDIFSNFMGYVTDYDLASLDESDVYEILSEYLHKVLSKSYVRRLFSSISIDDDIQQISFEMKSEVDEYSDKDFINNILAKGMILEWLEPQVKKTSLIHQHLTSSKESKFYSQSSHLSELRTLYSETEIEFRRLIKDRGFIFNPYLGEK